MKIGFAVGGVLAGVSLMVPTAAHAAGVHYARVTPDNFKTIFKDNTETPISSYSFVFGPPQPPLGAGSLQLSTVDSAGHQQHLEQDQQGTPIAAINAMQYFAYRHAESTGNPVVEAALNLPIFTDPGQPDNKFTTLVFEPYQNQDQQPVLSGVWQRWDAYKLGLALWHSTRLIPGTPLSGDTAPWSVIVAANPHAVVLGYGPNQGSNNPGIISNVDALVIGTAVDQWVYDFEPTATGGGGNDGGGGGDGGGDGGGGGGGNDGGGNGGDGAGNDRSGGNGGGGSTGSRSGHHHHSAS